MVFPTRRSWGWVGGWGMDKGHRRGESGCLSGPGMGQAGPGVAPAHS